MRERPGGTVTFLFTDVEGSTRLLHELGDRYAEVLAEHRRALRDAFSGRPEEAAAALAEGLRLFGALRHEAGVAVGLQGLATAAVR